MSEKKPSSTIRVSFGSGRDGAGQTGRGDSFLSAELDDREDGPNGGNTQFTPGGTAYFLIHKGKNVTIDAVDSSAGSTSYGTTITYVKEEEIVFEGEDTASLSMPSKGVVGVTWLGRDLGGLTLGEDKQTVKAGSAGVAVAKVRHTVDAIQGSLTSPASIGGVTDFSIAVVITGTVAASE